MILACIYVSFIEYMFILFAVWFRNLYRDHHINSSLPEILQSWEQKPLNYTAFTAMATFGCAESV